MKNILFLITTVAFFSAQAMAQDSIAAIEKEVAYNKTINERSQKIVNTLGISAGSKADAVKKIIAAQYKNLNAIYLERDLQIAAVKEKSATQNKAVVSELVENSNAATNKKIASLHKDYISQLCKHLTPQQVEKVKDGMTYNVLNVTYKAYNQMIRTLTETEKQQIMTWLVEARELAMDAESSDKKHGVFGKYKGRINNYLSGRGYNLKKEGDDWEIRIKEEAEKKKISN